MIEPLASLQQNWRVKHNFFGGPDTEKTRHDPDKISTNYVEKVKNLLMNHHVHICLGPLNEYIETSFEPR